MSGVGGRKMRVYTFVTSHERKKGRKNWNDLDVTVFCLPLVP